MKKRKLIYTIFIFTLLLNFSLLAGDGLVLVANKSVSAGNLSKQDVRRIYLGEMQSWKNGSKLIAINLPANNALRQSFQKAVLGMTVEELQKFWSDEQIKGNIVRPPVNQSSTRAVKLFVSKIPGAVGYIPANEVDDTVKVLTVDGKKGI